MRDGGSGGGRDEGRDAPKLKRGAAGRVAEGRKVEGDSFNFLGSGGRGAATPAMPAT